MNALKISGVKNSLGVTLPREVLTRLRVVKGDRLFLTESPEGYLLSR